MMNSKVAICVKDGAVFDVEAPPDIDVHIRDYDVEGVDGKLLNVEEEREPYREMIW